MAPGTPRGLGAQYLIELYGCTADSLSAVAGVEGDFLRAAAAIDATVLAVHFHQFEPHGVSGVLVISESHFCVHTWPEHGYAAIDLFTCGPRRLDPAPAIDLLSERWRSERSERKLIVRGTGAI